MKAVYNNEVKLNDVYLDKADRCYMCANQDICPLVGAIETNFVYMAMQDSTVEKCEMFKLNIEC